MAKAISDTCGRLASSAATTNATLLSATPVDVYHIIATNTTASVKYLKLYNTKAAPVIGTDTPLLTIAIPPSNAAFDIAIPGGIYFNLGLGYGLVGAAADSSTTAVAAGDVVGLNIIYKA